MEFMSFLEGIFRWLHVVFGILWIGLLYFFNFVNSGFAPTMDADTKKKVVPELMPRALYWFRWGAAFTWITGVLLLMVVYYHGKLAFDGGVTPFAVAMIVLVFVAPFIYDALASSVMKDLKNAFIGGLILSLVVILVMAAAGLSFRGYAIHLGSMFGTIMAFNVWFRIWPSQRTIITATKEGTAPDPAVVALAGLRSRHNTYMSVPLVYLMLSQHMTWLVNPVAVWLCVPVGWALVYHIYDRAGKLKGF